LGVTILAKLQLAALRRARVRQEDRSPYFLYVDEFQNFATMSFVQMLSEARKYKLFLIMAEQSTQQQAEQRLVDIVLANVGTVITFRTGSPADERLILPLFKPYVSEGELSPFTCLYVLLPYFRHRSPRANVGRNGIT
jgi:DNA helicase HerA-like ATPase